MLTQIDQIHYEGQPFSPAECGSQGKCVVVDSGLVGYEGFFKNHGIIVKDLETEESLVLHHEAVSISDQVYWQIDRWLNARVDSKLAVLQITGDQSLDHGEGVTRLEEAHPCSWEFLRIPSKTYHWSFLYDAEEGTVPKI